MMDSAFGKYATYKIAIGDTPIQRRYNHFQSYYQAMAKCWPGIYVPRLPQKQPIVSLRSHNLGESRRVLSQVKKALALAFFRRGAASRSLVEISGNRNLSLEWKNKF